MGFDCEAADIDESLIQLAERARASDHQAFTSCRCVDVTMLMGWFTGVSLTLMAYDVPSDAIGLDQ